MTEQHQKHFSKTYKIYPVYEVIFQACLDVHNRNRLTEYLIKEYFSFCEIKNVPLYNKTEIFEFMISLISNTNEPIYYFNKSLRDKRVMSLRHFYINECKKDNTLRSNFNVRIPKSTINTIFSLSSSTDFIGEVVELAIANYISVCDEKLFKVIKFAFEQRCEFENSGL